MKKLLSLLLGLILLCSSSLVLAEDWYLATAQKLNERMGVLVGNESYLSFYMDVKQDGVEEELAMMAETVGCDVQQVVRFRYAPEKVDAYIESYFICDRVDDQTRLIQKELTQRMNLSLPMMLNRVIGGDLWIALASSLQVSETFVMPDDFAECTLALDFGKDTAVLVTFSQTGEETVTAQAAYIRTESLTSDLTAPYLNLLWEKE